MDRHLSHSTAPATHPTKSPLPPCPACGGLECLCRPRFFAGQLLTDEDLTRLERYIVEKNKLHNRYLHGWGAVCGLEVVCDPCAPTNVIVQTGYALSPCGEDIVVCRHHSVNVCELIEGCRDPRTTRCDPPYDNPPRECTDGIERWVLAICYDERPSRGVTALRGDSGSACCSACACGGSGACGCHRGGVNGTAGQSVHGAATATQAKATRPKHDHRPQCEPTLTCEGYRFEAYREPKRLDPHAKPDFGRPDRLPGEYEMATWLGANRERFGPLLTRLLCCFLKAMAIRTSYREGRPLDLAAARRAYAEYADVLRGFAAEHARHRCAAARRIVHIDDALRGDIIRERLADTEAERARERLAAADLASRVVGQLDVLDRTWLELLRECVCSALLPPCPDPVASDCVPLAVVTVRTGDCSVLEICNWEERKFALTMTNVQYWLSWMPWHQVREGIEQLCCKPGGERTLFFLLSVLTGIVRAPVAARAPGSAAAARPAGAAGAEEERVTADPVTEALGAERLMEHLARVFEEFQSTGVAPVPIAPLFSLGHRATAPEGLAQMLAFTSPGGMADAASVRGELGELRRTVEALSRTVAEQNDVIARLRRGEA